MVIAPVLQAYEVAPAPVKVAVAPAQMVGEFTVVIGDGLTVTVVTAVHVVAAEVTVTVYVPLIAVVAAGRVGFCKLEVKPPGPAQLYVPPPVAFN